MSGTPAGLDGVPPRVGCGGAGFPGLPRRVTWPALATPATTPARPDVRVRTGGRSRGLRLRVGDEALVFTLADGRRVEVSLTEAPGGGLVVRGTDGPIGVRPDGATAVVVPAGTGGAIPPPVQIRRWSSHDRRAS